MNGFRMDGRLSEKEKNQFHHQTLFSFKLLYHN